MARAKLTVLTFTAKRRPSRFAVLPGRTAALIRQQQQQCCCYLIYNCPFYGGQAPPPAGPASIPPSKPLHPRKCRKVRYAPFPPSAFGDWRELRPLPCSTSSRGSRLPLEQPPPLRGGRGTGRREYGIGDLRGVGPLGVCRWTYCISIA